MRWLHSANERGRHMLSRCPVPCIGEQFAEHVSHDVHGVMLGTSSNDAQTAIHGLTVHEG